MIGDGIGKIKALDKPMQNLNMEGKAAVKPIRTEDGRAPDKPVIVDINSNVYRLDDELIPAGAYYNVRAIRAERGTDEIVMGEAQREKRVEASFALEGDGRILRSVMRQRMDVALNITTSFNTEDLICNGCKERGPHTIAGLDDGQPVVLRGNS